MKLIKIGSIAGSHGLKGHFKILPQTEHAEVFFDLEFLLVGRNEKIIHSFEIDDLKVNKNNFIMKCSEINDIDSAKRLSGLSIYISSRMLENYMSDDECLASDFIGADVFTVEGDYVGKVIELYDNGSNELFAIKSDDGKEYLISNNEIHVPEIDVKNKKIIIDSAGLVSEDL